MCHVSLEMKLTFTSSLPVAGCLRQCSEKRWGQVSGGGLHSHMVWALPEHRSIL